MGSTKNNHPAKCLSDYMNPINYTSSYSHDHRHSCKGRQRNVDHIIHVTHAGSLNLSCSEAMLEHARLAKLTLVYLQCNVAYTHHLRTQVCQTPDRHGLPHTVELCLWCTLKEEHFYWY
jgi:hypothetical protein